MRRFVRVQLFLVTAAALAAAGVGATSGLADPPHGSGDPGSTFGPRVAVGMARGEPRIAVAPDGTLWAAASQPLGRDTVFTSTDNGDTWAAVAGTNVPFGGGDDDILITPDGTVWLAGQEPGSMCESVAKSAGDGAAFVPQPIACGALGSADRPWLASSAKGPNGQRILLYFNLDGTHVVTASDDDGVTWTQVGSLPAGRFPGNLVVDDDAGYVYATTTVRTGTSQRLVVYRSADLGASWTAYDVASLTTGDKGLSHVYLAKDSAGNLYTAWADDPDHNGIRIWFARSTDHAQTWSVPKLVSGPTGTHVFPAIDAGSPGRVVVAWYETPVTGDPNALDATAPWHVEAVSSVDGGFRWSDAVVSDVVNHSGILCTKGGSCSGHRLLLDFISVALDRQGSAHVIWADDNVPGIDLLVGPVQLFTARSDPAQGVGAHSLD